jgi:hypothetical protein
MTASLIEYLLKDRLYKVRDFQYGRPHPLKAFQGGKIFSKIKNKLSI